MDWNICQNHYVRYSHKEFLTRKLERFVIHKKLTWIKLIRWSKYRLQFVTLMSRWTECTRFHWLGRKAVFHSKWATVTQSVWHQTLYSARCGTASNPHSHLWTSTTYTLNTSIYTQIQKITLRNTQAVDTCTKLTDQTMIKFNLTFMIHGSISH